MGWIASLLVKRLRMSWRKEAVRRRCGHVGQQSTSDAAVALALDAFGGLDTLVECVIAGWGRAHALGRVGSPTEVGEVIAFVTSPRASFVTGGEIRVDGGLLARSGAVIPDSADQTASRVVRVD